MGNNRFQAAKYLGKLDELRFKKVDPPVEGTSFRALNDVTAEPRMPKYRGK